jgi:hypothetical protein
VHKKTEKPANSQVGKLEMGLQGLVFVVKGQYEIVDDDNKPLQYEIVWNMLEGSVVPPGISIVIL